MLSVAGCVDLGRDIDDGIRNLGKAHKKARWTLKYHPEVMMVYHKISENATAGGQRCGVVANHIPPQPPRQASSSQSTLPPLEPPLPPSQPPLLPPGYEPDENDDSTTYNSIVDSFATTPTTAARERRHTTYLHAERCRQQVEWISSPRLRQAAAQMLGHRRQR